MKKEYDSDIIQMCHEEAVALHKLGAINDARMKEFDDICSAPEVPHIAHSATKVRRTRATPIRVIL